MHAVHDPACQVQRSAAIGRPPQKLRNGSNFGGIVLLVRLHLFNAIKQACAPIECGPKLGHRFQHFLHCCDGGANVVLAQP